MSIELLSFRDRLEKALEAEQETVADPRAKELRDFIFVVGEVAICEQVETDARVEYFKLRPLRKALLGTEKIPVSLRVVPDNSKTPLEGWSIAKGAYVLGEDKILYESQDASSSHVVKVIDLGEEKLDGRRGGVLRIEPGVTEPAFEGLQQFAIKNGIAAQVLAKIDTLNANRP